jgi:hypothetical protein
MNIWRRRGQTLAQTYEEDEGDQPHEQHKKGKEQLITRTTWEEEEGNWQQDEHEKRKKVISNKTNMRRRKWPIVSWEQEKNKCHK